MSGAGEIRAVLTDIEGTTSSLSFVKDVLFPYARTHLGDFVRAHAHKADIASLLDDVRSEAGRSLDLHGVIRQLEQWIDEDRKMTPLKALQGLLWECGYKKGDFRGHVYADAQARLAQWQQAGLGLYVYSSGSIHAQKLLFGYTEFGDLNSLFSGYFDTTTGAKADAESYRRITEQIGLPAEQILFLSDIEAELDAARQAGLATCWLVRDGAPDPAAGHQQVADFSAIEL